MGGAGPCPRPCERQGGGERVARHSGLSVGPRCQIWGDRRPRTVKLTPLGPMCAIFVLVDGGGVGRDRGKPLADGGHDVVGAPAPIPSLEASLRFPLPDPTPALGENPNPRLAVAASRCRSPS